MKYQTKLAFVTAIQLTADNAAEVQEFLGTNGDVRAYEQLEVAAVIDNPSGLLVAKPSDYIIRQDANDVYPCPEHVFINKYELAGESVDTGAVLTEVLAQAKAAEERADKAEKLAEALKKQLDAKPAPVAAKPA
jgi:hypothetical protein